jgi:hypothetical protein
MLGFSRHLFAWLLLAAGRGATVILAARNKEAALKVAELIRWVGRSTCMCC